MKSQTGRPATQIVLARYGAVPEVARCRAEGTEQAQRGATVIVLTHRGRELGTVLESIRAGAGDADAVDAWQIEGLATAADLRRAAQLAERARVEFSLWQERIAQWNLDLQLIDLEWTLDEARLILYVLNERGPECTKLAIQAAAAGWGVIDVQPVSAEGLLRQPESGGGCGDCGCHA